MIDKALKETLDQLLNDWHHWAKKTTLVPQAGKCAMFAQAQSPRHWDTTGEIALCLVVKAPANDVEVVSV